MINIDVDDHSLPEIDNLYLDLNGLVHMSTHSNSLSGLIPHLAPAPPVDEVWAKVFAYIEMLLQLAKPRRLVYFAIDGVAPVAKCCQQRTRRYKHVHEVDEFVESERKEGRDVVDDWFDSSCITQGTDFMEALTQQVEFYIKWKFATDQNWKKLEIIMSGGNVPGEGEHKILNYLRQCGTEPNLRHCIYGLDADLILLGLTTHQPFVLVLREDVNITFVRSTPDRAVMGVPPNFKVLFLNLVREYMQVEVDTVPGLDLEQFIDDFVFLSLFMGNDFLPRTPTFEIGEGALDFLIEQYKEKWPTMGYLTDKGIINWNVLLGFLEGLMEFENTIIIERIESRNVKRSQPPPMKATNTLSSLKSIYNKEANRIRTEGTNEEREEDKEREPRENMATKDLKARLKSILNHGVEAVKSQYYIECLRIDMGSPDGPAAVNELALEYLKGLQWVLCYYYRGCPDWEWFYPSHYCPMANELRSAIVEIQELARGGMIPFQNRGPIRALEQLLIVLPRKTRRYVPDEIQVLYDDPALEEFFPDSIQIEYDIMCATVNWHSLKLMLPFPNVQKIRDKMNSIALSSISIRKNTPGHETILRYDPTTALVHIRSPNPRWAGDFFVTISEALLDIAQTGCFTGRTPRGSNKILAGLPSLDYIKTKKALKDHGVNVFGNFSKLSSVNLEFKTILTELQSAYNQLYNKLVYVNYPIQQLALVVAVSDSSTMLPKVPEELKDNYTAVVQGYRQDMVQFFRGIKNIEVKPHLNILVHVLPLRRAKRTCQGKFEPEWEDDEKVYPLELVMLERDTGHHLEATNPTSLAAEYPRDSKVVIISRDYYGCLGTVIDYCTDAYWEEGGLEVQIDRQPLDMVQACREIVKSNPDDTYVSISRVPHLLDCPRGMINLLVGSFRMKIRSAGKTKILQLGLNLKNDKTMSHVQGWARWGEYWVQTITEWQISSKAIDTLKAMKREFSVCWSNLKQINWANRRREPIDYRDIFSYADDPEKEVERMALWVLKLPCSKLPWVPVYSDRVSDRAMSLLASLPRHLPRLAPPQIKIKLNPGLVYKPSNVWTPVFSKVPPKFELGDRVMNLSIFNNRVSIPFGAEGTVVGVFDTLHIEVLFDDLPHLQGPALIDTSNVLNLTSRMIAQLRKEQDIPPYKGKERHTDYTFRPEGNLRQGIKRSYQRPEESKLESKRNYAKPRVQAEQEVKPAVEEVPLKIDVTEMFMQHLKSLNPDASEYVPPQSPTVPAPPPAQSPGEAPPTLPMPGSFSIPSFKKN
eukprot:CAMPEP_0204897124 /NCGR_PEP_ID=MMETSP1397-20131031/559_1 /ASSEMBLY_ACC=CAM_ASM_000891 /TAXON_ID=49980 /ORGANISM="Climacostomum Climacostomum virens, Strain Stock W-24" /LENGTH=1265 /DNA_ID=CAMNT_0052064833 /DNA_START=32 /DNA_END=3829 /DNA_ORIENTATION=-